MLKFHEKKPSLYGFGKTIGFLCKTNFDILLYFIEVNSKQKLHIVIIISFLLLYAEMMLILFLFSGTIYVGYEGFLSILCGTSFFFFLCKSYIPYWGDTDKG